MKITDIMKQAQNMQREISTAQEAIKDLEVTGESGAGMVAVRISGDMVVQRVTIDPSVLGESREVLEDLIVAAVNDAFRKAQSAAQEKIGSITAGLNLPEGFKLPL